MGTNVSLAQCGLATEMPKRGAVSKRPMARVAVRAGCR